jgi:nucleoid-associated protein YgaU
MDENRKRGGSHRSLILLLLLILFGGVGFAAWYGVDRAPFLSGTPGQPDETPPKVSAAAISPPSFDVLRAEPSGALIAAGRSTPNATVNIMANGKVIGSATADAEGEWVFQPEAPLAKGDHVITLEAMAPGAPAPTASDARVAVSIAGGNEQPLVTVMEEGKPTEVIQIPAAPQIVAQAGGAPQEATQVQSQAGGAPQEATQVQAQAAVETQGTAPAPGAGQTAAPQVAITQTDYDENGTSRLYVKGVAAPGQRVTVYVDNVMAGMVVAGPDGKWSLESNRKLTRGDHTIRADALEAGSARVVSRAEADFARAGPDAVASAGGKVQDAAGEVKTAEARTETSAVAAGAGTGPAAAPEPVLAPSTVAPEAPQAGSVPAREDDDAKRAAAAPPVLGPAARTARRQAEKRRPQARFIVVRRGDTLWDIAQRRYGRGYRYTRIYRSNRDQIRDPNLIYPNQRIILPR